MNLNELELMGGQILGLYPSLKCESGCLKMFDWDAEYASVVKFYAELAMRAGWREYVRDLVREKMQEPVLKNLSKDVAAKIKELENDVKRD